MWPKTDNGSVRTEEKTEKGKNGFYLLLSKLSKNINVDQTSLVCMGCMRFCLLVQFVHLRPWELGSCSMVEAEK